MTVKGKVSMGCGAILILVALLMLVGIVDPLAVTVTYAESRIEGSFYINDFEMTQWKEGKVTHVRSHLIVSSPTLTTKFVATSGADQITVVRTSYQKYTSEGTLEPAVKQDPMTKSGSTWTGTITLPSQGRYRLCGFVSWVGGWCMVLSVEAETDEMTTDITTDMTTDITTDTTEPIVTSEVLGAIVLVVGLALLGIGFYWEKQS